MRTRLIGAAALTAALASVALADASASGAPTKVTIKHQQGGFFGFVDSASQPCEAGREVKLFKMKGTKPQPKNDKLIGNDFAQPNGPDSQWSINTNAKHGDFYAFAHKVPPQQRGSSGCARGLSKVRSL